MDFFTTVATRRSTRMFTADPVSEQQLTQCLEAARQAPSCHNIQPWRFLVVRDPETRAGIAAAGHEQPVLRQAPVITILLADRDRHLERFRRALELVKKGVVDNETVTRIQAAYLRQGRIAETSQDPGVDPPSRVKGVAWMSCFPKTVEGLALVAIERTLLNHSPGGNIPKHYPEVVSVLEQICIEASLKAGAMVAGEHYVLAATALGLGACWVGLFDPKALAETCGLPESHFPVALLPTGVPMQTQHLSPPRPRRTLSEIAWKETPGSPWNEFPPLASKPQQQMEPALSEKSFADMLP